MPNKISKKRFKGISKQVFDLEIGFLEKQNEQKLAEFSISESLAPLDFSLKNISTDLKNIENPNILEASKFVNLNNSNSEISNKFSEESDPIFDFDENLSSNINSKNTNSKKLRTIARKLKSTKTSIYKKR